MSNEFWARRLFASIAADLEPHGWRELWEEMLPTDAREKLMRSFPAILPKWWLYLQARGSAI
jgi:hypothetical protein